MLAAVGVTFMTCVAINNRLREQEGYTEPPLKDWLDIVALGTVLRYGAAHRREPLAGASGICPHE